MKDERSHSVTEQTDGGLDRRSLLKRAAVVGAATAWATPTVQSIAAPAFALGSPVGGECTACLTGGGQILTANGLMVTYNGTTIPKLSFGLGPLCCDGHMPTEIQVNAHPDGTPKQTDPSWHFTQDLVLSCTSTGNPAPPPGTAECPNHFSGTVSDGKGNTLTFVFEDNGEPGVADLVRVSIAGPQGTLEGTGTLDRGNLQAHESLGPVVRDCSGCA